MKEVKWSCKDCLTEGSVKYDPPGNPYRVGYEAYQAHANTSPDCKNLNLDFIPFRLPEN